MEEERNRARYKKGLRSLKEVSEHLGVSVVTVRRMIDRHELLSVRVGRRVMVPAELLDRFISKQMRASEQERNRG